MNWLSGFKKATHAIAVAGGLAAAWAVSDAGQKVIGGIGVLFVGLATTLFAHMLGGK